MLSLPILFLVIFAMGSAVAAYARSRGGNPWRWGALAVGGFLAINLLLPAVFVPAPDSPLSFWLFAGSLGWVGVVAFCARFVLGAGAEKPAGMWVCPSCKMLNQHYAVVCDACQTPYEPRKAHLQS